MNKQEENNLNSIFKETLNQFNYSSNLFDSLESRINTVLLSISIILIIFINSYFLERLEFLSLITKLFYSLGISYIIISFILMINSKRVKLQILRIKDLKEQFKLNPQEDFRKIIITKYIPIIDENIYYYHKKYKSLQKALLIMKIGLLILISVAIYVFIS